MRIAALILVLMLVVAIATEVDGVLGRRRRRRKPSPKPTPAPCDSCSCCMISGKRSVLDGDIYSKDASLLEDEYSRYKWLPLWVREAVLKDREQRALNPLTYPRDCNSAKLRSFATKCGMCVTAGGSHYKVCDGAELVTTIPHTVKPNGTCRSIIKELNDRCL